MRIWRKQSIQSVVNGVGPGGDDSVALHSHGKMRAFEDALRMIFGDEDLP